MLAVFSFFHGDLHLAEALAELVADFGNVSDFDALIVTPSDTNFAKVQRTLAGAFRSVEVLAPDNIPSGWPIGPNIQFSRTVMHVAQKDVPFIFLEADVVPTRPTWLKEINAGYISCAKPHMGMVRPTWLRLADGTRHRQGDHMVGVGVYPKDLLEYSDLIGHISTVNSPFDYVLQGEIVYGGGAASRRPWGTGCYDTPLMSHHWGTRNWRYEDNVLKCDQDKPEAICDEPNLRIPALAHGCKDLSLLNLVREQFNDVTRTHLPPGKPKPIVNPEYLAASHVDVLVGSGFPSVENQLRADEDAQRKMLATLTPEQIQELQRKGVEIIDGNLVKTQPSSVFVDDLPKIGTATKEDAQPSTLFLESVARETEPAAEFAQGEALDSLDEHPASIVAPEVIEEQAEVPARAAITGTAPEDQSQQPLVLAIRADASAGMNWKGLLAKYKLSPKKLKEHLNKTEV